MTLDFTSLKSAQSTVAAMIDRTVTEQHARCDLEPEDLREAAFSYLRRGGKRLRPLLLVLAAGAAGGEPERLRLAALAVEVFHTWTLIHDDLIDRDEQRRGGPAVHAAYRDRMLAEGGARPDRAEGYGLSVAVLSGDFLHGLAVRLVLEGGREAGVDAAAVSETVRLMVADLVADLVKGEMLDVAYSYRPVLSIDESKLLDMQRWKSAALMDYSARVGAMLAQATDDRRGPIADALGTFAESCGSAFQLQDDVLGITGDEQSLGKPVGSDIREGKRTLILLHAYKKADAEERAFLDRVLGDSTASPGDVAAARDLFVSLGGIEHTRRLAAELLDAALSRLEGVPASVYRDRLAELATSMIHRDR